METSNKRTFIGRRNAGSNGEQSQSTALTDATLNEALDAFIHAKQAEGVRPRTIDNYREHIRYLSDYLRTKLGYEVVYANDLTSDVIRSYIQYLRTEKPRYEGAEGRKDNRIGLSVNTINIRLRTLRTMCRFWAKEGITETNAMETVKNVVGDTVEEVPGISDDGIDSLLASYDVNNFAEWRDKILVMLLLDTGLRITEAVSLTVDNVDYRLNTVYVPSQVAKNRRMREVPMSREVAKLLRALHEESCGYFGESPYIFHNAYGEPFTAGAFRTRLNRRKKRLGFPRLSPHMFRHTFCRNYLLNGGDLFTLQKIVDHADIDTTRKYVQMDDEHVRQQHNKYSPVRRLFNRR
ncbi:tyrosine-type recombinase/integrase [Sporosarcina sp. ACRSL]|uniref:tyrosine-type recombinase/integrase n=1 Tax=Sporosarcina sp. ACRSL TaxID=2918215 RepID=UPI001EF4576C|nr:tyrosine-type recombinase/integrase [Sporosarcina sp. ACRSL]MCG7345368.1 tyrosine-type recombinase/integrase [Sporosarcina sp. ACRSL]